MMKFALKRDNSRATIAASDFSMKISRNDGGSHESGNFHLRWIDHARDLDLLTFMDDLVLKRF